jgi:NitT/TauT family transport system ATP-binding protein
VNDLIAVESVSKAFPLPEGKGDFTVLDKIDVRVDEGEVVALLGRSGSGKSTLLRIMAGLIPASSGTVTSSGKRLNGPNSDVGMVFQSFALLPWLTVIENVELGLEARGVGRVERTKRALKAIDTVGLDGFESAYPKELSGGMKQRVGFARALVVEPKVLFMDEPFSALDVLTAENLRGEIDDLWNAGTFPARSILIVTHNIEEAVFLADRVVVLGANPGRVRGIVKITLKRPHDRNSPRFKALTEYLYDAMTNPSMKVEASEPARGGIGQPTTTSATGTTITTEASTATETATPNEAPKSPYARPLPHVRVGTISGLLELIVDIGAEEIANLSARLALPIEDFLAILEAAVLLGFATVRLGCVAVTPVGRDFATTTILRSKDLFRQQVLERVPIVKTIASTLASKDDHEMNADFFLDILDEHYPKEEARRQFDTAIEWGRYAELYEYDATEERLTASEPAVAG